VQMWSGAVQMWSGAVQMWSGAVQMWSGVVQMWSGAVQIWSGVVQMWSVVVQMWCRTINDGKRKAAFCNFIRISPSIRHPSLDYLPETNLSCFCELNRELSCSARSIPVSLRELATDL